MARYDGGCHCGAIAVSFETETPADSLVPRADQCSFCRKHHAATLSDPAGQIEIVLSPLAGAPYRFGLNITDFHLCRRCGVFVAASWRDEQGLRGVVNMRALNEPSAFSQLPVAVSFDGEGVADRGQRRRLHWTPARILGAATAA
jgi:hypothetical protein